MNIHLSAGPLVSLLAGILILIVPRLLNYIVAIYLIIIGLLGLFGERYPASAVTERRSERRTENIVRGIRSLMRSSGCNRAAGISAP